MAGYTTPLASATSGIAFTRLSTEEIRKISVKRIYATPALDSMLGPVPGGLYDPALGAINALDLNCTTCRLNSVHCVGHPGHIDLPVPCYHPLYIETTFRLLRGTCAYCFRFRSNRNIVNKAICQLRLLQQGLVEEYKHVEYMHIGTALDEDASRDSVQDLVTRRTKYVHKALKKAKSRRHDDQLSYVRNPVAIELRAKVIREFIREVSTAKDCSQCRGLTPAYRKDRAVKMFRKALGDRAKEKMRVDDRRIPNPLLYLQKLNEMKADKQKEKPTVNGLPNGVEGDPSEADEVEEHGAEDEIAMQHAAETSKPMTEEVPNEENAQTYLSASEVHAALAMLFQNEQEALSLLFSRKGAKVSCDMFFINAILVPPNRYRPLARQGPSQMLESHQNGHLNKIINASNELRHAVRSDELALRDPSIRPRSLNEKITLAVALQEAVNAFIDSPPNPMLRVQERGIKQELEKKEGLFRMNMMGKRVNFAARSVISPDPNIETNEIGVPLVFAKKLTFPEPVTRHNFELLSKFVVNGADEYPGAAAVEGEDGRVMSLKRKSLDQRKAIAKQLLTTSIANSKGNQTKKVYRHLLTGDFVIMNRQPTLHKPSMMGHKAKVLSNQKTIRMHYANCNTYNADFDGDEMNMHFPQNKMGQVEASMIADTDHQYLSATAGKPLRGLIQDHISMGVQFTSRDTFFDRDQYQELLYSCLRPEENHCVYERLLTLPPAVLKPKMLWSGKQVISTVLQNITQANCKGLNLEGKSTTAAESWGEKTVADSKEFQVNPRVRFRDTEQTVIFKDGELICGILDKAQLGPSVGGVVYAVHEIYGHTTAGRLLSILGRLLTRFLNERAWSCGMDDLYLTNEGDNKRRHELRRSKQLGHEVSARYVNMQPGQSERTIASKLEDVLRDDELMNGLDQMYKAEVGTITNEVSKQCLPAGLRKPFPRNQMQAMTGSGAKGSGVNANLISCNLGQQVLEGRRVPIMVSGKTLPSFRPFETDPVAGGYVSGRFLTGIKPQEYYFHAMSGREGLIDTAVKTSKSGYLQRCLVKGLEGAKTGYDNSVREVSNGSIIQFLYGEDGLEVTKSKSIRDFKFVASNYESVTEAVDARGLFHSDEHPLKKAAAEKKLAEEQKAIAKSLKKQPGAEPLINLHPPGSNLWSTSESFSTEVNKYAKTNPDLLIRDKSNALTANAGITAKTFRSLMALLYLRSTVPPQEAVGVVGAQSLGEPSTQMTLNTFHLAGHSAKNVTLGIPRLREIIMTATPNIKTPQMTVKLIPEISQGEGQRWAKTISKLPLSYVVQDIEVTERAGGEGIGTKSDRLYDIKIQLYPPEGIQEEYSISPEAIIEAIGNKFLPNLDRSIRAELKKKVKQASLSETTAALPNVGESVGRVEEQSRPTGTSNDQSRGNVNEREGGEDDLEEDEDADPDDAKDVARRSRREDNFDEPDDEDEQIKAAEDAVDEAAEADDDDDAGTDARAKARSNDHEGVSDSGYESDSSPNDPNAHIIERAKSRMPALQRINFPTPKTQSVRPVRIILSYDANTPKILLLPLLERACQTTLIRSIPGITLASLYMEDVKTPTGAVEMTTNPRTGLQESAKEPVVTTSGINIPALLYHQDTIHPHSLTTNSPHAMLGYYGVEAARLTIIREISGVFASHGISVDNRHINLIADVMTWSGGYKAFSRHGVVNERGGVLGRMSYETVMGYLRESVLNDEKDTLDGVSGSIVAGKRIAVGTGETDVLVGVS